MDFSYLCRMIMESLLETMRLFPEEDISALKTALAEPKRIFITTHKNPDGDAMGSTLALCRLLRKQGHTPLVVTPNPYDPYLAWMPEADLVISAEGQPEATAAALAEADLIFCLDFGALVRCGDLAKPIGASDKPKIMVDHHIGPEDFPWLRFHVEGISSTAELIYRLALQMGWEADIDRETSECLYTGLMTDTGSFRFSSTTPEVHLMAADLIHRGIEVGPIHNHVFDNFSETRTRLLGYVLHEKLQILRDYRTAYMTISLEDKARFDIQQGDTEGFVNYGLSLKGIIFAVIMKETEEGTKMSFRSIGDFPANDFAKHFGGGGHFNAAGGRTKSNLVKTEKRFLDTLERYKDLLNKS